MDRYSSGDSDVYQLTDAGRRAWVSQSRAVKFSSVRDSVRRQRKEVLAEVIEMIGEIPLHFYMSGCTDPQNASRILKLAKVVPCVPFPSIGTFKVELAGEHQYFTEDGFMADPENSFDVVKWRDLPLEKLIELACVLDKYLKKHWGRKTRR
jgi:thiazole synthase ThiGH ThiG subunit